MAFHKEKKRKLWVWIAIDRYSQEVLAFSVGSRGRKTYKKLIEQLKTYSVGQYATDNWKIYKSLPKDKHVTGKKYTTQIESLNANIRHYLDRFRRKTRCYSKCPVMVELSLIFLFNNALIKCLF